MKEFLGLRWVFGLDVVKNLMQGRDLQITNLFPREGLCPVNIRLFGSTVRSTAQCVLPVNMFNEPIFIGLWFWMIIVGVTEILSTLVWLSRILSQRQEYFVIELLKLGKGEVVREFVKTHLQADGVLLLRLIQANVGTGMAQSIGKTLWERFKTVKKGDDFEESANEQLTII